MQSIFFRQLNNLLQLKEPRLHVLIYHRVMPEPDPLRPWEINQKQFADQMRWISQVFRVIPLSQAIDELSEKRLQRRSLVITFDDGYLDNVTHALPVLQSFGFSATFFCTSAWLDGGLMWNDQVIESIRHWPHATIALPELELNALPVGTAEEKNLAIQTILPKLKYEAHSERSCIASEISAQTEPLPELMMRPEHLKQLHQAGMEIGGHTHSHPILAKQENADVEKEIAKNKSILENIIDHPIRVFAYPNGKRESDFLPHQKQIISKLGYDCAVTTEPYLARPSTDMYEIPRFTPWDRDPTRYLLRLASNNFA